MQASNPSESSRAADLALVERCTRGDHSAFEAIYRAHAPRVYGLACRLVGDRTTAEDVLQDVFVLVHRKLGGFRGESSLGTWIHRLATNCCLDFVKSRQHRAWQATNALDEGAEYDTGGERLDRIERLDLDRAIASLPDGYRAALVLHDVEGLDHREVAARLGIAEGTSKSQVHKARLRVRAFLRGGRGATRRSMG